MLDETVPTQPDSTAATTVELPFDVFCDALHFVCLANADGLADTLIACAAESGYGVVDIAQGCRPIEGALPTDRGTR